jgi:hypothetical protein
VPFRSLASVALLAGFVHFSSGFGFGQTPSPVCQPTVTGPIVVASPAQRLAAGQRAQPALFRIDTNSDGGGQWRPFFRGQKRDPSLNHKRRFL